MSRYGKIRINIYSKKNKDMTDKMEFLKGEIDRLTCQILEMDFTFVKDLIPDKDMLPIINNTPKPDIEQDIKPKFYNLLDLFDNV
jgi:hypothetical protein